MLQPLFRSKTRFIHWLRRLAGSTPTHPLGRLSRRAIPRLEVLEDRLAPATFTETNGVITITLTAKNETVTISSNGANNYHLSTTDTTNGFITAGLVAPSSFSSPSGSTSGNLAVNPADTQITIVDSASFSGGSVVFADSGANPYSQNINVTLTNNAASGPIDFYGTSTFNDSLTASTAGGSVTVEAGSVVNLSGSAAFPGSTLTQSNAGGLVEIAGTITTSASETTLTVRANRNINEAVTGVIKTNAATTATFTLTGSGGTINLDGGANDFAGPVAITGSVTTLDYRNTDPAATLPSLTGLTTTLRNYNLVTDNASIPLGTNVPSGNTLTFNYTAGGDITQTSGLTFGSATFTVLGNNSILLNTAGNTIGTVSFIALKGDNTTQVSYLGSGNVTLGTSSLGLGTFNITAQGNIAQSPGTSITENIGAAGSTFTATSGGTTITLNNNGNDLEGPITFAGTSLTTVNLTNASLLPQFPTMPASVTGLTLNYPRAPITLPSLNLMNLTVTAQGVFEQATTSFKGNTTAGSMTVSGLASTAGLFVGQTITGPGIPPGTTIVAITGSTIKLSAAATATATGVTLTASSGLTVTNNAVFNAGNNPIVLDGPNNFSGSGTAGIQVTNAGPNQVVINNIGALNFGAGNNSLGNGTLTVTVAGNITQSNRIRQAVNAGQTTFSATGGNSINLTPSPGNNQLTGIVDLFTTGNGSATVTNGTSLNLGTSVIGTAGGSGSLSLNVTGGSITQDPGTTLTVAGGSSLTASGTITLDNNGNAFHGNPFVNGVLSTTNSVSVNGSNVTIRASGGPINLNTSAVTNALTVRANGAITQVGAITGGPGSSMLFDAGIAPITLTDPGNGFSGGGGVSASSLGTPISFTGSTTDGSTTVSSVSSTTGLIPGQTVTGTGIPVGTTITAISANSITLSNKATATGTGVALTAAAIVQLTATGNLQVGRINLATGLGIGANALILTAGSISEAATNSGITQAPLAGAAAFTMQQGGVNQTFTGSTTNGSATVSSVSSTANLFAGEAVAGPGIPTGTTIKAISTTSITLSQNATATATNVALTVRLSEKQALSFTATTGTFGLAYDGQVTAPLPANASAAAVQSALQALTDIGAGNVSVTGSAGNYVVTFQGTLASRNVPQLSLVSAGNIVLNPSGTIALNNPANNWSGLVDLNSAPSVTGLTLNNIGSINFLGTPLIAGTNRAGVNLTAGQTLTIPDLAYTTWTTFSASAKETDITQNITTTSGSISITGTANLGLPATALTLTSASNITFIGDVNVLTTTAGLTLATGFAGSVNLDQGTWSEGTTPLTINGTRTSFNIGNGSGPAVFNMVSGTISMTGGGNVNVGSLGTFEVGDTTNTTTVDTVTLNNGSGSLNFNPNGTQPGGTLSVGLGTTNDQLVDVAGNVMINSPARLTAYSGVAGATATPVLTASAGTVTGFFDMTVDPTNDNAPYVFLMGTDIVTSTYLPSAVTIGTGGTQSTTGTVTGYEPDSDKYTITASTGASAQLATAVDLNGLLDVVVRNAVGAVTLTITTTTNLGDGLTQLGGIAVDGPGTVTINAPTSDINLGNVDPFADILVQGPLAALTIRDFNGFNTTANSLDYQDFVRAGGTNAQSTTITGRIFDSVSIALPSVLKSLTLAQYTDTIGLDTVTAESFGTITTTGVANTFVLGDFNVSRLTNRDTLDAKSAGLATVTIAHTITGQFDINGPVTSVTSQLAANFSLGLPGGANNRNGDLMGNVATLNLGIVTNSNIESIGTVASTTAASWVAGSLLASSFTKIAITGNAALPASAGTDAIFGNFTNVTLTATAPSTPAASAASKTTSSTSSVTGLGTLTVAGDANTDTFDIWTGNVGTITVARQLLSTALNAGVVTPLGIIIDPVNSKVGTITAGTIGNATPTAGLTLNARLLTSLSAVGNAADGIFGDIIQSTVTILGNPISGPIYTGIGIGTVTAARNMTNSSFTVVNGSLTSVTVAYQMSSDDVLLLNNAGTLGTLTTGAWNAQLSRGLVAASIGTITVKGAPLVVPNSALLVGNLTNVNILAFVNTSTTGGTGATTSTKTTPGIGTFNVTGSYTLLSSGFLRSDNGITTFTVGRDVTSSTPLGAALISVRNPNTGKVNTMTVGRWLNSPTANVDFVADTIGTLNVTGYTALEVPSKINGDFLATNFVLLNTTKVDATSITVANNEDVANLLAPGGIGTLTVANELLGRVDADNRTGTLGAIGTLQAGQIGVYGTSAPTAIPATLRAVTFGTLKTVINIPLGADGSVDGSTVTATGIPAAASTSTKTSSTPTTGIGTVSIASFVTDNFAGTTSTFDVPGSISTFTVTEDVRNGTQIGAGYAPGARIKTFTAGAIADSVLTARNIGTLSVIGHSPTVLIAAVLTADVTNSVVTALGNLGGVGLGTVTIKQKVTDSDFNVAGGSFTSMTVGGMFGSHVTVGAHPAQYENIVAATTAANWDTPPSGVTYKLGSFKTTGLFDPTDVADTANFRDSFIVAQQLGTVTITGLDLNVPAATATFGGSAAATFGVAFRGTPPAGAAGPSITMSFSNNGVLKTQTLTAPTVVGTSVRTTPPSAFSYVNLAG